MATTRKGTPAPPVSKSDAPATPKVTPPGLEYLTRQIVPDEPPRRAVHPTARGIAARVEEMMQRLEQLSLRAVSTHDEAELAKLQAETAKLWRVFAGEDLWTERRRVIGKLVKEAAEEDSPDFPSLVHLYGWENADIFGRLTSERLAVAVRAWRKARLQNDRLECLRLLLKDLGDPSEHLTWEMLRKIRV